jgi:hypothetical protein
VSQPRDDRQDDLFGPSLEKIINLRHPLVRLAAEIDWDFLAGRFGSVSRSDFRVAVRSRRMPALKSSFYKLDGSGDIFNWDAIPIVNWNSLMTNNFPVLVCRELQEKRCGAAVSCSQITLQRPKAESGIPNDG